MSLNFQQIQHEFTACLRDPQRTALPHNVPPQRMQIYRDLFYNNIEGFLAQGFPLLQRILTQKELWHPLVHTFFASHACT
ncbi:MAG TPA: DNA-binding domain-containing protein, partial [Pseudomonadales bacterium]|nr:DNA-binding domain-containing protein [Pseudomonadales bacterium]